MNQKNKEDSTRKLIMNGVTSTMKNIVSMRDDIILLQSLLNSLSNKTETDNDVQSLTDTMETSLDAIDEKIKTIAEKMIEKSGISLEEIQRAVKNLIDPDSNNSSDGSNITDQFR